MGAVAGLGFFQRLPVRVGQLLVAAQQHAFLAGGREKRFHLGGEFGRQTLFRLAHFEPVDGFAQRHMGAAKALAARGFQPPGQRSGCHIVQTDADLHGGIFPFFFLFTHQSV